MPQNLFLAQFRLENDALTEGRVQGGAKPRGVEPNPPINSSP